MFILLITIIFNLLINNLSKNDLLINIVFIVGTLILSFIIFIIVLLVLKSRNSNIFIKIRFGKYVDFEIISQK